MIDMHVHILPGVDDGAKDVRMAQEMMKRAADAGITFMVATPHVYHAQDQMRNRQALRTGRAIAHSQGLKLNMGCEFNYRALREDPQMDLSTYTLSGTNCLLFELSNSELMPNWETTVSEMIERGIHPIIAHPERYTYIQRDMGVAQTMCMLGCELQVDACGLMAPLMSDERRTARKLLSSGLVSYIASDAHRPEDYADFVKVRKTFGKEWPTGNRLTAALTAQRKERMA